MSEQVAPEINDGEGGCPVMHGSGAAHTAVGATANQH